MASKTNDNDEAIAEINIVPFVDIILVVLIIFMVTTPLIMKPGIKVNLPKASSGEDSKPSPLNITISSKGIIQLNGNETTIEEIQNYAKKQAQKDPGTQAIISADKDVSHGVVMSIIDSIKSNGLHNFAIATDNKR